MTVPVGQFWLAWRALAACSPRTLREPTDTSSRRVVGRSAPGGVATARSAGGDGRGGVDAEQRRRLRDADPTGRGSVDRLDGPGHVEVLVERSARLVEPARSEA